MHTTNLRKVGGSVMLAVPPALLDTLNLAVGAKVNIGIEDVRLAVTPKIRTSHALEELLAQCEDSAPDGDEDRAWLDSAPAGRELLSCSRAKSGSSASTPPPVTHNGEPGRLSSCLRHHSTS